MSFDVTYAASEALPLAEVAGDEQQALAQAGSAAATAALDALPAAVDRSTLEVRVCGHANAGYVHQDGIADTWVSVTLSERHTEAQPAPVVAQVAEDAPIVTATGESPEVAAEQPGTPDPEATA